MTRIRRLVDVDALWDAMDDTSRAHLEQMRAEVAEDPARLDRVFPAAARRAGRGPLAGAPGVLTEDAVRVDLVAEAARDLDAAGLLGLLGGLYRYGDADEKRAVVHALNGAGDDVDGSDLLLDALRTNDTRLVGAAMGAHASRLSDEDWRQGVLKCLFTGVPATAITGLADRADPELAAMARRYATEREAAGREVPPDVQVVLTACDRASEPEES